VILPLPDLKLNGSLLVFARAAGDGCALRRALSTPAEGRSARRKSYAVRAQVGAHFGHRMNFTSADEWLKQDTTKRHAGRPSNPFDGVGAAGRVAPIDVEPFSIREIVDEREPELEYRTPATRLDRNKREMLRAENQELQDEMARMMEEMNELKRQLADQ